MQWTRSIKKYRTAILLFCGVDIYLGSLSIYGVLSSPETLTFDLSPMIPLESIFPELMLALAISTLVAILGALIGGYALAPLYLLLHKTLYRNVIYGVQEKDPPKALKTTLGGWYPTLLAFHVNSILILSSKEKLLSQLLGTQILDFPGLFQ